MVKNKDKIILKRLSKLEVRKLFFFMIIGLIGGSFFLIEGLRSDDLMVAIVGGIIASYCILEFIFYYIRSKKRKNG